jgi:hypothetical protein
MRRVNELAGRLGHDSASPVLTGLPRLTADYVHNGWCTCVHASAHTFATASAETDAPARNTELARVDTVKYTFYANAQSNTMTRMHGKKSMGRLSAVTLSQPVRACILCTHRSRVQARLAVTYTDEPYVCVMCRRAARDLCTLLLHMRYNHPRFNFVYVNTKQVRSHTFFGGSY